MLVWTIALTACATSPNADYEEQGHDAGPAGQSLIDASRGNAHGDAARGDKAHSNTIRDDALQPGVDLGLPPECAPVRRHVFSLAHDIGLYCDQHRDIFAVEVPGEGLAVARASLTVRHLGLTSVIHFWNSRVIVGQPEFVHGIGDDLCPDDVDPRRMNIGYGRLSPAEPFVRVEAKQGASSCWNGVLEVLQGSILEVWVEDPRPECRRQNILVQSYYQQHGYDTYFSWSPYQWKQILSQPLQVTSTKDLLVIGVLEGSPHMNPNRYCGQETKVAEIKSLLDSSSLDYRSVPLPATQGMGHLVLETEKATTVQPGTHEVSLWVNQKYATPQEVNSRTGRAEMTTGGCCGDAYLVTILDQIVQ